MKKWEKPYLSDLSVKFTKNNGKKNHNCPVCHQCFLSAAEFKAHKSSSSNPGCKDADWVKDSDFCQIS